MLAKLAAPGMCNPLDDTACVDGAPSQQAIDRDARSTSQRNHDGLTAGLRALLASGKLGQHNGLPASIIITTTLADLEAAAGRGLTGGGTVLPMSDVIRLARHAHHYLAVFDKGKAWPCITPNGWPPPGNESCCTPMDVTVVHPTSVPGQRQAKRNYGIIAHGNGPQLIGGGAGGLSPSQTSLGVPSLYGTLPCW